MNHLHHSFEIQLVADRQRRIAEEFARSRRRRGRTRHVTPEPPTAA